MNKYYTYYYLFYNKSKNYYITSQYNKLTQEISRLKKLELKLFADNNNGKEINNNELILNNDEDNNGDNIYQNNINEAKLFLKSVKNFFENNTLIIYYVSIQNYFSSKGLLISKKYKLLNEYEFFEKFNKEKEEYLSKQIKKDKKLMSKAVINKTENKLFNYFNYESLTSKKMIKTLSTLGLLSLTIIGILYLKKKYQN